LEGQNSGGCPNIITGKSTKPPPDSSLIVKDKVDAVEVMGVAGAVKNIEDSHTDVEENSREKLIDEEPSTEDTDMHHTHNDQHLNLLTNDLDRTRRSRKKTN
jgi:hypothetical protein